LSRNTAKIPEIAVPDRCCSPRKRIVNVLSFIIIARNQVRTVLASLDSAFRAARTTGLASFEVIYVDSNSTDGTVDMVEARFGPSVRVARLTGEMNAGIARNVGAKIATGRSLFFVDGDMELDPGFLRAALNSRGELIHPLITGQLPEKLYDAGGQPIGEAVDRYRIRQRHHRAELGGVFLIDRGLFQNIGGFAPELRCNEDLDLGLRLAQMGTLALAIDRPIALHHTIEYLQWNRLLPMIRNGSLLYPGVLFRRHFANRRYLRMFASHQRPTLVLLGSLTLATLVHPAWGLVYLGYVAAKNLRRSHTSFAHDLAGTTARSICFLAGTVGFFPRRVPAESITFSLLPRPA